MASTKRPSLDLKAQKEPSSEEKQELGPNEEHQKKAKSSTNILSDLKKSRKAPITLPTTKFTQRSTGKVKLKKDDIKGYENLL